jgi:2-iminobutanoate/2-iminopropanoate deaminase
MIRPTQSYALLLALGAALPGLSAGAEATPPEARPIVEFVRGEGSFPFSPAVQVDKLLFLSGQIGFDAATGELVEGGIAAETRQTMDGIKALLQSRGLGMDSLVKCTVMLVDMAEWPAFNEVYRAYFEDGRYPARSAFGASGLALGARVEVECIAAVG